VNTAGYRDDLAASRARNEQLEAENAALRVQLASRANIVSPTHAASPNRGAVVAFAGVMLAALAAGTVIRQAHRPMPAPAVQAFDRGAAAAALGRVDVASCKEPGGPTGAGHVSITFSPNGLVTSVVVDREPFVGTSVAGCISAKFREARVPVFSGSAVKVGKSFAIE
jgi:hypothetical protein